MEVKKVIVEESGKKMDVFIPQDPDDHSYNEYLEEAEVEKTKDQLKKSPDKPTSKYSKEDIAGALKEHQEFVKRQKGEHSKKYF